MKTKKEQLKEVHDEYMDKFHQINIRHVEALIPETKIYKEAIAPMIKVYEDSLRHIAQIRDTKFNEIRGNEIMIIEGKKYRLEE